MPGWDAIHDEIRAIEPFHEIRKKHIANYCNHTGRNAIFYYSAWLSRADSHTDFSITDNDMVGFMNAVKDMDRSKGLDLFLHTPGGTPTATEAIVKYLRNMFDGDIRAIVPQLAMSAGTMLACACKSITMGKQSSLGPIDPQLGGIPAFDIRRIFEDAKADLVQHPENTNYWAAIFSRYNPAIIYSCVNAIELSGELVSEWLSTGMFANEPDSGAKIDAIVSQLNQNEQSKNHGRHFDKDTCRNMGLNIIDLETDSDVQELVLSVHHAFMLFLVNSPTVKIIENNLDKAYIIQKIPPQ